tara:strand:- start:654 stop:1640 length:987 start_codon:yes stop_codon:yes gene_type:complete
MNKKAIVFGITGQDGSYLMDLLLKKEYSVIGVIRRSSVSNTARIDHEAGNKSLTLVEGDVTDAFSVSQLMQKYKPDEAYNLAAQSHVKTSFDQPMYTWKANAEGPMHILESIRQYCPDSKFYQASTSEMFGKNYSGVGIDKYQCEETGFIPQSPYAIAKLAAHHTVRIYREAYDLFACCGILFNHESERRGELFVTRKISKYVARFSQKLEKEPLRLGNLDAYRDWGHAQDYVRGMWMMLQQSEPDDYILATGRSHTVRDFLDKAFYCIGIKDWSKHVVVDPEFYRPAEVDYLRGSPSKARLVLDWHPLINFEELVSRMVNYDIQLLG